MSLSNISFIIKSAKGNRSKDLVSRSSFKEMVEEGNARARQRDRKKFSRVLASSFNGSSMHESRFGDEDERLMHLVPAPAVILLKRRLNPWTAGSSCHG